MHETPDPQPTDLTLTPSQCRAVQSAARALRAARVADLAALDTASLILMVESLRGALDETLRVIRPTCDSAPRL